MGQHKVISLLETVSDTAVGFVLAYITGRIVFPLFGASFSAEQNFWIVVAFTAQSLARKYVLRRLFNRFHVWMHHQLEAWLSLTKQRRVL